MQIVLVRPMRIARLPGQGFKGARDAGQFQRARLRDDEIAGEGGGAHARTAQEPAVVVGGTAARHVDVAERGRHRVERDAARAPIAPA